MNLKALATKLSGYWLYKERYLPIGIDLFVDLKQFFKEKEFKIVFDVGANEGQSIRLFQSRMKINKMISFEPVPSTYRVLTKHNQVSENLTLENIGLGEFPGEHDVFINKYSGLNSLKIDQGDNLIGKKEKVIISTLDDYTTKNGISEIDFLKIDTEGFEMEVLKGGIEMIRQRKIKYIYCEVGFDKQNKRHTSWESIHQFLLPFGYRFVALYDMSYKVFKDHSGNALYVLSDGANDH